MLSNELILYFVQFGDFFFFILRKVIVLLLKE